MKERRGPVGRVGELAAGLAAAARRRQQERQPRVLVYDATGHGRALAPDDPAYEALLGTGEDLIELVAAERA